MNLIKKKDSEKSNCIDIEIKCINEYMLIEEIDLFNLDISTKNGCTVRSTWKMKKNNSFLDKISLFYKSVFNMKPGRQVIPDNSLFLNILEKDISSIKWSSIFDPKRDIKEEIIYAFLNDGINDINKINNFLNSLNLNKIDEESLKKYSVSYDNLLQKNKEKFDFLLFYKSFEECKSLCELPINSNIFDIFNENFILNNSNEYIVNTKHLEISSNELDLIFGYPESESEGNISISPDGIYIENPKYLYLSSENEKKGGFYEYFKELLYRSD